MKFWSFIFAVIFFYSSASLAQPIGTDQERLSHVAQLVDRGKAMIASDDSCLHMEYARTTKETLLSAEKEAERIRDYYYAALAYLLIAEGYAYNLPQLPRPYKQISAQKVELWFPYKDAMRALDKALWVSGWLKKTSHPNKYGFIGDISFFVHLQYDKLRGEVEVITPDVLEPGGTGSPFIAETPSRICYTRAMQAIEQAYENERLSLESQERKKRGIKRWTAKAYLYQLIGARFKRNGIESSEPALINVPPQHPESLRNLARRASEESQVRFSETKVFKFFDFLGKMFIPKYGLAKDALSLIFSS